MIPVDLYSCRACGSIFTEPLPPAELLAECYAKYSVQGYPQKKADAKSASPAQSIWYDDVWNQFAPYGAPGERIADIGAGEGILAKRAVSRADGPSHVTCLDYHGAPDLLDEEIRLGKTTWKCQNLSVPWGLENSFDRVFCIAVLEHVLAPKHLVEETLRSLKPGGKAHFVVPTSDAALFKCLGRLWPYWIPGEHLTLPSRAGLRLLIEASGGEVLDLRKTRITYSVGYLTRALFGFGVPAVMDLPLRLPIGVMSATFRKPDVI